MHLIAKEYIVTSGSWSKDMRLLHRSVAFLLDDAPQGIA